MLHPPHIPKLTFPAINNRRAGGAGEPQKQCLKKSPLTLARDKNRNQFMEVKGNLIEITQFQHQVTIRILFKNMRQSSRRNNPNCATGLTCCHQQELGKSFHVVHKTEAPNLSKGSWKGLEVSPISLQNQIRTCSVRHQGSYTIGQHSMQITEPSSLAGVFLFLPAE